MTKMKYIVKKEKKETKILNYSTIEGFLLPTKSNKFIIDGNNITKIIIINKKFASPFVSKIVLKKYQKLIKKLTDLFISEEDPGTTMNEVLTEIQKFKDMIKKDYRKYLKKKELEKMAIELKFLQKEAQKKQTELFYIRNEKSVNRTR